MVHKTHCNSTLVCVCVCVCAASNVRGRLRILPDTENVVVLNPTRETDVQSLAGVVLIHIPVSSPCLSLSLCTRLVHTSRQKYCANLPCMGMTTIHSHGRLLLQLLLACVISYRDECEPFLVHRASHLKDHTHSSLSGSIYNKKYHTFLTTIVCI